MEDLELYLNKGPVALKKFTLYVWHKKPQSHLPCWNTLIFHTHVFCSTIKCLSLKNLNNVLDSLYKKYDLIQVNSSVLIQFQCCCFIKMVLYRSFQIL